MYTQTFTIRLPKRKLVSLLSSYIYKILQITKGNYYSFFNKLCTYLLFFFFFLNERQYIYIIRLYSTDILNETNGSLSPVKRKKKNKETVGVAPFLLLSKIQ